MRVLKTLDKKGLSGGRTVVATIGVYDGIHLGHRRVIENVIREAGRVGGDAAVITFDPHPRHVLDGAGEPPILTSLGQKLRLLSGLGLDICVVLPFTRGLAGEEAADFVVTRLLGSMTLRAVYLGPRFSFGRGKTGDAGLLQRLGKKHGFSVNVMKGVRVGGARVSSTAIRRMIACGDCEGAARLLGRPYSIEGRVKRGKALGRLLGCPTANLDTDGAALPPPGVYAAKAVKKGELLDGVLNIDSCYQVELHLIDFEGDIYGELLEVVIGDKIREERIFTRNANLAGQMRTDIEIARRMLHNMATSSVPTALPGRGGSEHIHGAED